MAKDYAKEVEKYENILRKSKTAYSAGSLPSSRDISAQLALNKAKTSAERAKGEELKKKWYGEDEPKMQEKGYFGKLLHGLSAPLYATVGVAENVLGKGTKKGLANIIENVKEEGTAGDLLRSYGLTNAVAAPLGFALDVALDPLNWFTAGTAALLPRVGLGALKGGVSGAAKGLSSGLLMKAEKVGRAIPGLSTRAFVKESKAFTPTLMRNLSAKSVAGRIGYEAMTGGTVDDMLLASARRDRILDKVERELDKTEFGRNFKTVYGYTPGGWYREQKVIGDAALNVDPDLSPVKSLVGKSDELKGIKKGVNLDEDIRVGEHIAENPKGIRSNDPLENTVRMRAEGQTESEFRREIQNEVFGKVTTEEQKRALHETLDSGVKMWDKFIGNTIESDWGRGILSFYLKTLGLFKTSKIGGNLLAASVNSIIGNPTMAGMAGIDILNSEFGRTLVDALGAVTGRNLKAISAFNTGDWRPFIQKYPELFKAILGFEPEFVLRGGDYLRDFQNKFRTEFGKTMMKLGKDFNKLSGEEEVFQAYRELNATQQVIKGISEAVVPEQITKGIPRYKKELLEKAISPTESVLRRQVGFTPSAEEFALKTITPGLLPPETPTTVGTYISQEMLMGPYGEFVNKIKRLADEGKPFAKAFNWYLTKPMKAYEKVDQTFKVGTALHLSQNGISYSELRSLAKRWPIAPEEVTQVSGRNLWKLKPDKALEISSEIYMNYAAMPGFVKMMRVLPILGSPFVSFAYGSTALALKAGLYNPSYFNKVNNLLKEISGERSPLEKKALNEPYYSWYDREGMVKLPFFKENPVYLNAANMLTYYTLNMFQPSERDYKSKFGGALANFVDKTPFFKMPEGQLLMDYAILPLITGEAQGQFGQPLWPSDAGTLEKVGRATLAGTEAFVPSLAGVAGLVTPEALLPYAPSYRWRKLGYAMRGKSSLGIPGKEPAAERTMRELGAIAGFPTYKMDLSFINTSKNKNKPKKK